MSSTISQNHSLLEELEQALQTVGSYGSVEIYVQDSQVTQITARKIKKTQKKIVVRPRRQRLVKSSMV